MARQILLRDSNSDLTRRRLGLLTAGGIALWYFRPDLVPKPPKHTIRIVAGWGGHFIAPITANGVKIERALFDTGATFVSFAERMAAQLGFHNLNFTGTLSTASGRVAYAPVKLASLTVSGVTFKNVDAVIQKSDLEQPVLGMSLIARTEVEIVNGVLTMRY